MPNEQADPPGHPARSAQCGAACFPATKQGELDLTDLALQTKAVGIDRTVLVQVLPQPGRDGGAHLAGIRHLVQGEPDPRWLARPDVRRGLHAVAAAGLAYDLLTLPHQLPAAIDTVRALPGLTFVLDHLSKPP